MKTDKEPEVPANYFGKGENYILPDDVEIVSEFERRWKEYEISHPDDPTGELALAKWNEKHGPKVQPRPPESKNPKIELPPNFKWAEIELVMPEPYVERFKNFAKAMRRRPRDILMGFIDKYCPDIKPD